MHAAYYLVCENAVLSRIITFSLHKRGFTDLDALFSGFESGMPYKLDLWAIILDVQTRL
jgi:hypothetical protein